MRVLMTEGASSSARQALYGVPRSATVDLCAPSWMVQCRFSSRVRRVLVAPWVSGDPFGFLTFLREQVAGGRYDVLLPTHEETYLLSRFRDELGQQIGLAVPPFAAIRRVLGKIQFAEFAEEIGLPTPATKIGTADEVLTNPPAFPCFLKTEFGTASQSVRRVDDLASLRAAIADLRSGGTDESNERLLLQQPASGIHCTVQSVFQEGRLIGIHMAQAEEVGFLGTPMVRIGCRHPGVEEDVRRVGESLDWHGPIFLEYFFDPNSGKSSFIEVNPRIGEVSNAWLSGTNLVEATLRIALGQRCDPLPPGRLGVRSHAGFVWLILEAAEGGNRRAVWRRARYIRRLSRLTPAVENETTRFRDDPLSLLPAIKTYAHLLCSPPAAQQILTGTVDAYALSRNAVRRIDEESDRWEKPPTDVGATQSD